MNSLPNGSTFRQAEGGTAARPFFTSGEDQFTARPFRWRSPGKESSMKWIVVKQNTPGMWAALMFHVWTEGKEVLIASDLREDVARQIVRDHNAMLASLTPGECGFLAHALEARQLWPDLRYRLLAFSEALGTANENDAARLAPPEAKKAQLGFEFRYGHAGRIGSSTILVVAKDGSEARRFFEIIRPQATIYAMLELNQYVFYPAEWASCFASSEGKREPAAPSSGSGEWIDHPAPAPPSYFCQSRKVYPGRGFDGCALRAGHTGPHSSFDEAIRPSEMGD